MQLASVEAIVRALNAANVRYLIVGGLAVVAHGYVRFTADVDLVVQLDEENVLHAVRALAALGYAPRVPVRIEEFAEAKARARWIEEKQMKVFSLSSPLHPETVVDLFATVPFEFDEEHARAVWQEITPGVPSPFVSLERLLEMKRAAARDIDRIDIAKLEQLRDIRRDES